MLFFVALLFKQKQMFYDRYDDECHLYDECTQNNEDQIRLSLVVPLHVVHNRLEVTKMYEAELAIAVIAAIIVGGLVWFRIKKMSFL